MDQKLNIYRDMSDRELSMEIGRLAEAYFAEEVKIIDVEEMSCVVDYLILMTGNSSSHVRSLCSNLDKPIRLARERLGMEGRIDKPDWILLDYGTINIHIFDSTSRLYYNLDELWNGDLVVWEEIKKGKKRG